MEIHDQLESNSTPVPVSLLTGFLGAGKTTLLNRILNGDHGLKIAVLVNDFGDINIDAELVVGIEDDVISLANGCVCCQVRDDLIDTVEEVLAREDKVEYILLEASGVADPRGIAFTFVDAKFRDRIRLDSITCVVDADQVFANPEYPDLQELKLLQVGFSDMVVLNKVDLAGPEKVEAVKAWIKECLQRVRILETNHCDVPLEILLSVGRFDPSSFHERLDKVESKHHEQTNHGTSFQRWSYRSDRPMSLDALNSMVRERLPGSIYRCKGIIYCAEEPDRRAVLQVVGRRTDVSLLDRWGDRKPETQIVAIASRHDIDESLLQSEFDSCLIESRSAK